MKKALFLLTALMLALSASAQKDVTKFLGIPVDGTKAQMIAKLKAKGFTPSKFRDADFLEGEFNGSNVHIYIATNNNKVCRIMVCDEKTQDEANIKIRFNKLVDQFKNNKRYLALDDYSLSDKENISYEMDINKKNYDAVFYQKPDMKNIDTLATREKVRSELLEKYTAEQLENPTEELQKEIQEEIQNICLKLSMDKMTMKPVWFRISKYRYDEYYITMFYDNEYNRANGEDL